MVIHVGMSRNYSYNIMHTDRVVSFRVALELCTSMDVGAYTRRGGRNPNLQSQDMYAYTHVYADMCKYLCVYVCVCAFVYHVYPLASVGPIEPTFEHISAVSTYIKIHRTCNRTDDMCGCA